MHIRRVEYRAVGFGTHVIGGEIGRGGPRRAGVGQVDDSGQRGRVRRGLKHRLRPEAVGGVDSQTTDADQQYKPQ
jgi:hypothetical protein